MLHARQQGAYSKFGQICLASSHLCAQVQASKGREVHAHDATIIFERSAIGAAIGVNGVNMVPAINVESGASSRSIVVFDSSVLTATSSLLNEVAACQGLSIPNSKGHMPVALALSASEALMYNSTWQGSANYDASSYMVYSQSSMNSIKL